MAANLLKAGHTVTVWNRSPEAEEALVASGPGAADGLPAGGGMAIFARNVQRAVRIARSLDLRRTRRTLGKGLKCQHQQDL